MPDPWNVQTGSIKPDPCRDPWNGIHDGIHNGIHDCTLWIQLWIPWIPNLNVEFFGGIHKNEEISTWKTDNRIHKSVKSQYGKCWRDPWNLWNLNVEKRNRIHNPRFETIMQNDNSAPFTFWTIWDSDSGQNNYLFFILFYFSVLIIYAVLKIYSPVQ